MILAEHLDRLRLVPRTLAIGLFLLTCAVAYKGFDLAYALLENGDAGVIAAVLSPVFVLASALAASSAKCAEYLAKTENSKQSG